MAETDLKTEIKTFLSKLRKEENEMISKVTKFLDSKLIEAGKPEWVSILSLHEKTSLLCVKEATRYRMKIQRFKIEKEYISYEEYNEIYNLLRKTGYIAP